MTQPVYRAPRPSTPRTVWGLARTAFLHELQYRANFWVYLINAVMEVGLTLLSLEIVFRHVDSINGWTRDSLLVVVGSFFLLHVVIQGIVHPSVSRLVADIRTGNFDHRLLKPVDAQLVSLVQHIDAWRLTSLLLGIGLTIAGLVGVGATPSAWQFAAWVAMLACGATIAAAFWSLISSITFWTVQGEGILWTLDDMYEYVRWPTSIFPPALRVVLSTVYPLGLAVTVPSQALLGTLDVRGALTALGVALTLTIGARVMWLRAIRRYEGASG